MSNNLYMLPAVTTSAEGLDIINVIRPAQRKWDNMVFCKGSLFITKSTPLLETNFQGVPLGFSMPTLCPLFDSVSSCFQMGNIFSMSRTIITMIYLLRFCRLSHPSICGLLIEGDSFFPKQRVASLTTKMPFPFGKTRGFGAKLLATIITYSNKMGTIRFPNFTPSFLAYAVSFLKSLNPFWHISIIAYFNIYENPGLLRGNKE